uniref:Uncharacterized protein n=1 Tax=Setaria italica TaxID=4555 RepID=K3YP03_SETIT
MHPHSTNHHSRRFRCKVCGDLASQSRGKLKEPQDWSEGSQKQQILHKAYLPHPDFETAKLEKIYNFCIHGLDI